MEQRTGVRKMVSLDALIASPRFGPIEGTIVDLSRGGLYVRAETCIVPIGAEVTVTFEARVGGQIHCMALPGRVRHQSLQGCGIQFAAMDRSCAAVLDRMLPDKPPVPARAAPVLRAL
jgi:hypothetical protein